MKKRSSTHSGKQPRAQPGACLGQTRPIGPERLPRKLAYRARVLWRAFPPVAAGLVARAEVVGGLVDAREINFSRKTTGSVARFERWLRFHSQYRFMKRYRVAFCPLTCSAERFQSAGLSPGRHHCLGPHHTHITTRCRLKTASCGDNGHSGVRWTRVSYWNYPVG